MAGFIGPIFSGIASMYESVKTGALEREVADAAVSTFASNYVTLLWGFSSSKIAKWFGLADTFQLMAASAYKVLSSMEKKNFLTLGVPNEMLGNANLMARIQTERITK